MSGKKILIVEDDPKSLYALESVLQDKGFKVIGCGTAEACSALDDDHFDAAILDIRLPGAPGTQVAAELLQNHAAILIIFVTAFDVLKEIKTHFPGCIVLVKPIDIEMLLRLLSPPGENRDRSCAGGGA